LHLENSNSSYLGCYLDTSRSLPSVRNVPQKNRLIWPLDDFKEGISGSFCFVWCTFFIGWCSDTLRSFSEVLLNQCRDLHHNIVSILNAVPFLLNLFSKIWWERLKFCSEWWIPSSSLLVKDPLRFPFYTQSCHWPVSNKRSSVQNVVTSIKPNLSQLYTIYYATCWNFNLISCGKMFHLSSKQLKWFVNDCIVFIYSLYIIPTLFVTCLENIIPFFLSRVNCKDWCQSCICTLNMNVEMEITGIR